MKVKMRSDAPGSPDGIRVEQYEAGVTYDVPEDLAAVFVAEGLASHASGAAVKQEDDGDEHKQADGPAENKAAPAKRAPRKRAD